MNAWWDLICMKTEEEQQMGWENMQEIYNEEHGLLIIYLTQYWMPFKASIFESWTNSPLHFGNVETSWVEGSRRQLKSYLQFSTGDLKLVVDCISQLLDGQHSKHIIDLAEA